MRAPVTEPGCAGPSDEVRTEPARVLIVMPLGNRAGGGEEMLLHLVRRHACDEIRLLVAFLENGPMIAAVSACGVPTALIRAGRLRHPVSAVRTVLAIRRLARAWRADLVFGWMTKAALYAVPAARLARIPAAWYQLGEPRRHVAMDRVAHALPAAAIVTLSRRCATSEAALWPERAVRLVYPGVDTDAIGAGALSTMSEVRDRLGLPVDDPIIGMVGRLQRWKGFHVLLEALPLILRDIPNVRCVLVGGPHALEPDYPRQLEALITHHGLATLVRMTGYQADPADWMRAMDVVVHASQDEPFGLVVVEAMALGKPVVGGAAGGPAEIITDGVDGFLVPFEDAVMLADRILRCLRDPGLRRALGEAAALTAARYSDRRYADQLTAVLVDLARGVPTA